MFKFREEEYAEISEAMKNPPERVIARKLMALKMAMEELSNDEISKTTCYNEKYIYEIVAEYQSMVIKALCDKRVGGNHRSFSADKEKELFERVKEEAQKGKFPRGKEIRAKIEELAGKAIPQSTFYKMVERQKGRKVKPRGQNPKKADEKN